MSDRPFSHLPSRRRTQPTRLGLAAVLLAAACAGCGTTQHNLATQQLLESDAIDAAIAQVDFSPLHGRKIFFDDTYLRDYKGVGFVNSNYVISGLRQQILAAGCLLQEKRDEAEYILEGRLGTLGADQHDVVYGIPKNNALSGVSNVVPGSPTLPGIPELAITKKVASHGAAKIALFAYDLQTRERVWQSGLSVARSTARDTWILGAGPFQSGTIHRDRVRFAGTRLGSLWRTEENPRENDRFVTYERPRLYGPSPATPTPSEALIAAPTAEPQPPAGDVPPAPAAVVVRVTDAPSTPPAAEVAAAPPAAAPAQPEATPESPPTQPTPPSLLSADANARPIESVARPLIQQVSAEVIAETANARPPAVPGPPAFPPPTP